MIGEYGRQTLLGFFPIKSVYKLQMNSITVQGIHFFKISGRGLDALLVVLFSKSNFLLFEGLILCSGVKKSL
ncbi:hypothetical protein CR513_34822, partial [Mucuna pruriens]